MKGEGSKDSAHACPRAGPAGGPLPPIKPFAQTMREDRRPEPREFRKSPAARRISDWFSAVALPRAPFAIQRVCKERGERGTHARVI